MLRPVFILGVPRSGTTLLRVLLDSHSKIAGAPETGWITGGYGPETSFRGLVDYLTRHELGAVNNLPGVKPDTVFELARNFLSGILSEYLTQKNKEILVLKTPDDIKYIDFLLELFPDSKFIHIFRDCRDVACSTMRHKELLYGSDLKEYGDSGFFAVAYRWYEWELKVRKTFSGENSGNYIRLSYENLVRNSRRELSRICKFLCVDFEQGMTDYAKKQHDYPSWELGSRDVKSRGKINSASVGIWKNEMPKDEIIKIEKAFGSYLTGLGYGLSSDIDTITEINNKDAIRLQSKIVDENIKVNSLHRQIINLDERIAEKRKNIKQEKLKVIEQRNDLENLIIEKEVLNKMMNELKMSND